MVKLSLVFEYLIAMHKFMLKLSKVKEYIRILSEVFSLRYLFGLWKFYSHSPIIIPPHKNDAILYLPFLVDCLTANDCQVIFLYNIKRNLVESGCSIGVFIREKVRWLLVDRKIQHWICRYMDYRVVMFSD